MGNLFSILAARDGGFVVASNSGSADLRSILFAGSLEATITWVRDALEAEQEQQRSQQSDVDTRLA